MDAAQIIYTTVKGAGIPDPLAGLIVAQARHETADFTSPVFRQCSNAFGYKAVFNAVPCVDSPEGNDYEKYPSVKDSALEIAAWIKRRQVDGSFPADLTTVATPERYAYLLKISGYYGDTIENYTNGLYRFWSEHKAPIITLGGVLVLAAGLYFLTKKG